MRSHSTPAGPRQQPCRHCTHFVALAYFGTPAKCLCGSMLRIQAAPSAGRAFWMRETGGDDEPGPPGSGTAIASLIASDQPAVVDWAP